MNKPLGTLKNTSYFYVYLEPGKHTFTLDNKNESDFELTLKPNQIYYFKCHKDMGAVSNYIRISEVTENQGVKVLKSGELAMTVP